jgi:hypothetical protein
MFYLGFDESCVAVCYMCAGGYFTSCGSTGFVGVSVDERGFALDWFVGDSGIFSEFFGVSSHGEYQVRFGRLVLLQQ